MSVEAPRRGLGARARGAWDAAGRAGRRVDTVLRRFWLWRMALAVTRVYRAKNGMQRAGEIAFYALLSLVPLGALLAWLLGHVIERWGTRLHVDGPSVALERLLPALVPAQRGALDVVLQSALRDRGSLGLFGFGVLLVAASLVFGAVNRALAAIFDAPQRGHLTTIFLFSILGSAGGLLLIGGLGVLGSAEGLIEDQRWLSSVLLIHALADALLVFGVAFLLVAVVKRALRPRYILAGALLFTGGFELARWVYALYLDTVAQFSLVYGSLAGIVATIVWIYYVSILLLVSMAVVRVLQDGLHDRLDAWRVGAGTLPRRSPSRGESDSVAP